MAVVCLFSMSHAGYLLCHTSAARTTGFRSWRKRLRRGFDRSCCSRQSRCRGPRRDAAPHSTPAPAWIPAGAGHGGTASQEPNGRHCHRFPRQCDPRGAPFPGRARPGVRPGADRPGCETRWRGRCSGALRRNRVRHRVRKFERSRSRKRKISTSSSPLSTIDYEQLDWFTSFPAPTVSVR
jgi:hypothetical protein